MTIVIAQRNLLESPLNYFDVAVSRHRDGPAAVLVDFQGTLLGDCYSGYESIALASDTRITMSWRTVKRFSQETAESCNKPDCWPAGVEIEMRS